MSNRAALKAFFNTGDRPTEAQFADVMDSLAHLTDDLISQAEAEAGVATTPRIWTAERVKQAIEALSTGGSSTIPAGYEPWWCVLRNTGSGWEALNDAGHTPHNVSSVTSDGTKVTINYGKTYSEVGVNIIAPDEEYAATHEAGLKGLTTGCEVYMYQPFPLIIGRLIRTAGVWSVASLQSAGSMVLTGTFPNFTVTHSSDNCESNIPLFTSAVRGMNPITSASLSGTVTNIYLDPAYVASDGDRIFFTRNRAKEGQWTSLNPAASGLIGPTKNWWLLGFNKV